MSAERPDGARPLVTIGLPVYNGERYLARALDALLSQSRQAIEVIVSDNGSTDASAGIAEQYARRDPRVRVLRAAVNLGVEANFLRVLQAAEGSFFMWAACDDWWAPGFVDRMVDALDAAPNAVVAMSAVERVDEGGQTVDVVRFTGGDDPSRIPPLELVLRLAAGRPYHLFVYGLYRTSFLVRAFTGFPGVVAADRLFLCRVALLSDGFAYVDDVLHRRLVRQAPIAVRYADEPIGRLWGGWWPRWRLVLRAGPYLWRSPGLPLRRRLWVPFVVLRFAQAALGHTLVSAGLISRRGAGSGARC